MIHRISISACASLLLFFSACSEQDGIQDSTEETINKHTKEATAEVEPHRYGGWYCPDNFGFVPVDIQNLDEVPAIADRLPAEEELQNNMSLINVDTDKYPDAHALEMDLPRIAKIYSHGTGMEELIIVIQAIVVSEDTVVGYRFPNGGNGSARIGEVSFLSEEEVDAYGSQPFFYSSRIVHASKEDIWRAFSTTDYFKQLGNKFVQQAFFSSEWNSGSQVRLESVSEDERAIGYAGMVFGNAYLQIDYDRNGFHYSEKLLMIENHEENTTELFFASGPYPEDFERQKSKLDEWIEDVILESETN